MKSYLFGTSGKYSPSRLPTSVLNGNSSTLKRSSKKASKEDPTKTEISPNLERRPGVVPLLVRYDEYSSETITKHPKDPHDHRLITEALEKNEFTSKILRDGLLRDVVDAMYLQDILAKETVIKEGEKGTHLFVSAKGTFEVSIKGKGHIGIFDDVRVFGELAILYNDKRRATIKAITPGAVWVLDRSVYQLLMIGYNIKEEDERLSFLSNVEKLNIIGDAALRKVANLLTVEFFAGDSQIVKQGERGDKFYIIRAGTVKISMEGKGVVETYRKGQYFGEQALLYEDHRQATVTADPPGVECLSLSRRHFIDHFGEVNFEDIWNKYKHAKTRSVSLSSVSEYTDMDLQELRITKTLGVGGFGTVLLVQHQTQPELTFALKYMKKVDMVEQDQLEHVCNERAIQMACRSMFIVRLYRTYKDRKYIYFLMESCLGGDLWTLLQKQRSRRFDEEDARFVAACVLEAFAYLHERGIVYRDLKPENILVDEQGYMKITDFGFAKKLGCKGRTFTFAGTPEYVAPEIVLNKGHGRAVDYWAFGVFIFELLTGETPFRSNDPSHMKTYNNILAGVHHVEFPAYVSQKSQHVIEKLCRPLPMERLGSQKNGIKDIKGHKWFANFDWAALNERTMATPFRPDVRSKLDTRNFDFFEKDDDVPPDETSGWDKDF